MKITNHSDLFIPPANKNAASGAQKVSSPSTTGSSALSEDEISASLSASSIGSTLSGLSTSRAARVSQLANLYASGNYTVDSAKVAQSLVFGAFSISG